MSDEQKRRRKFPFSGIVFGFIVLIALMFFGNFFLGLITSMILVTVATVVEFNKRLIFGTSFPISVELMSVSVMFVTAKFGLNWGLFVAIAGMIVLVIVRQFFCLGTVVRTSSLIVLALLSSVFSPLKWYVYLLILHNLLQWLVYVTILGNNFVTASISRTSNIVLNVFVFRLMLNWL